MHRQTTGACARHLDGGARQVVRHQQLAHRGTADVARANEHDMHIYPLEILRTTYLNNANPRVVDPQNGILPQSMTT